MIDLDCLDGINIVNQPSDLAKAATEASRLAPSSMSQKNANLLTCMLITANVGTIFEDVS